MVHDDFPSDMWYHDISTEHAIISNYQYHLKFKHKYPGYLDLIEPSIYHEWDETSGKTVPRDRNTGKLTNYEQILRGVEGAGNKLKSKFSEALVLAGYYASVGLITQEEYIHVEKWYDDANKLVSEIIRHFRMIRGWKSVPDEEYDVICEVISTLVPLLKKAILDRYAFEREVEKRQRDKTRWRV